MDCERIADVPIYATDAIVRVDASDPDRLKELAEEAPVIDFVKSVSLAVLDPVKLAGYGITHAQVREALEGNLCRCTGYVNIVASVQQAAQALAAKGERA